MFQHIAAACRSLSRLLGFDRPNPGAEGPSLGKRLESEPDLVARNGLSLAAPPPPYDEALVERELRKNHPGFFG